MYILRLNCPWAHSHRIISSCLPWWCLLLLASKRGLPSVGFSQPHKSTDIQRCAWKVGLCGYMKLNIVTPCTLLMYQSAPPTKIQPYPPRRFVLPVLQPATCVPSASGISHSDHHQDLPLTNASTTCSHCFPKSVPNVTSPFDLSPRPVTAKAIGAFNDVAGPQ